MIAVRLQGRLGNQLFQYAFIYSTSRNLNESYYIDQYYERLIIADYFELKPSLSYWLSTTLFSVEGYKNFFSIHLRKFLYKRASSVLVTKIASYDHTVVPNKVLQEKKAVYEGFFQSEFFFKKHIEDIRKLFTVKKRYTDLYNDKYEYILKYKTIVTVHIRKGDYLTFMEHDLSIPIEYYHNLIGKLTLDDAFFIFISDEPNYVKKEFEYIENKIISQDSDIMDFQHLLRADVCIIANSTFSWWGAYLNATPSKKVYAPKYFLGWREKTEIPIDIYPSDWNIVSVN